MAAGNFFLRIRIEFSFTHRYADMLPAFQAKGYLLPGIRVSQVLSGCLIILGIVILFIIRKRQAVRQ